MAGGFCTSMTSGLRTTHRSTHRSCRHSPRTFNKAYPRNSQRGGLWRSSSAGRRRKCQLMWSCSRTSGCMALPAYPMTSTSARLEARARAWYCMRGLRPTSPNTTTLTCNLCLRDMEVGPQACTCEDVSPQTVRNLTPHRLVTAAVSAPSWQVHHTLLLTLAPVRVRASDGHRARWPEMTTRRRHTAPRPGAWEQHLAPHAVYG